MLPLLTCTRYVTISTINSTNTITYESCYVNVTLAMYGSKYEFR